MKLRSAVLSFTLLAAACSGPGGTSNPPPSAGNTVMPQGKTTVVASISQGAAYTVSDLGTIGGSSSSGNSIDDLGVVAGSSNDSGDQYGQAVTWRAGSIEKLGTLGGPNSAVAWPNHDISGLIAGISETAAVDPLGEDWSCQAFFPTYPDDHHVCLAFAWRNGSMHSLRALGGVNGYAAGTNNLGQIVGWAETPVHDPTCTAVTKFPNSFYQVLQFEPVVWQPDGRVTRLPTLSGDPDGAATATNDLGEVVGISGTCDQAVGRFTAAHAVLWQNGAATQIPNIGGISWNTPTDINDRGQVVGFLNEPGDTQGQFQPVGFIWSRQGGLQLIKPLPGDTYDQATAINNLGQVVGVSYTATTSRAFLWENGRSVDLNGLMPANTTLYLLAANDINDRGQIAGQALLQGTTQTPAFLATPTGSPWNPLGVRAVPTVRFVRAATRIEP